MNKCGYKELTLPFNDFHDAEKKTCRKQISSVFLN